MAMVDSTIIVTPGRVSVSTDQAQTITVTRATTGIVVAGASGLRGPVGEEGPVGPSGIDAEIDTDFSLIYRLST